jgi:biotin synthase
MTNLSTDATRWAKFAEQVLSGTPLDETQALEVLSADDSELLQIMDAAYRVRRQAFGHQVQLYYLMNAKSGLCPEDCSYCSQSKIATSEIPRYNLLSRDHILEGAKQAFEQQSKTYCMVISARGPNEREIQAMEQLVPEIKEKYDLKICVCLGLLDENHAERLAACGVDRVNHNLNTGPEHYSEICTTHTYEDRIQTLQSVRNSGMEICSGGIIGMGEKPQDVIQMAMQLRELKAESIPVNFLNPIEGTPLAGTDDLNPRYCLKVLAMFRLTNPTSEIRIAGGRELHLGSMQCLGLYAANSVFVGDYLTTEGQSPDDDYRMIEEMGFEIVRTDEAVIKAAAAETTNAR